ncbi:MAG: hypothetical protein AAB289_00790, partial [Chloroflexota bacterium]
MRLAIDGARDGAIQAVNNTRDQIAGTITGAVESVTSKWTQVIGTLVEHLRTIALAAMLASASGVGALGTRGLAGVLRRRLQWVVCPDCRSKFRAYQESCPECWLQKDLAKHADRSLGALLVDNDILDQPSLDKCLAQSTATNRPLEVVLLETGAVEQEQLRRAMFYYNRSAEMLKRRKELLAERAPKRWWRSRTLAPGLALVLLALVLGGVSFPNLLS